VRLYADPNNESLANIHKLKIRETLRKLCENLREILENLREILENLREPFLFT
jgi:transcription initiation factor IIE alpha subunit